jgi:hypothetical protein
MLGHNSANTLNGGIGSTGFVARDQPQMALFNTELRQPGQDTDHRNVGVMLNHSAQIGGMAITADLVQDHASNAQRRIERLIPQQERRDAASRALRIDHQQHRRAELLGQFGIAVGPLQVNAVEEADIALDEAECILVQRAREGRADLVPGRCVIVEVEAGTPGGLRQPQRIDIVRSLLEGLHPMAATPELSDQSNTERRLA